MTWFRVGGGGSGIPASLKTGMNDVLNKKFGTSIDYPANGWPDDVNLLGLLEEKNATGYVAYFDDGANGVPLKSCIVNVDSSMLRFIAVIVTGKNRFNASATNTNQGYIRGSYLTNSGGEISNVNYNVSEYIRVNEGEKYTLSGQTGNAPSICVYDASFNFVSGYRYFNESPKTITIDATGCYVRFSYRENEKAGVQFEAGETGTTFEAYFQNVYEAELPQSVTGGTFDIVAGTGIDESQNPVTFDPVPIDSITGINNIYAKRGEGDSHPEQDHGFSNLDVDVIYRSSGTQTPVIPTLISKSITLNGTYRAIDDQATGYSEVVVNVPQPTVSADPIMSLNAFVTKSDVSGTDVSTVARSFTMSVAGTLVFASGSYGFTNTGSNEGYFEIQKNGVSVVKQYCNTSTNTPITIPNISVEENDVVDLVVGFDNAHSNCNFQFYSAMVVLSEV